MLKVLLLLSFHNETHLYWLKLLLERGVNTESVKTDYLVFFKLSLRQIFQGVYLPLRTPHRLKNWFSDRKGFKIWYDVFALSRKKNLSKTDICFFSLNPLFVYLVVIWSQKIDKYILQILGRTALTVLFWLFTVVFFKSILLASWIRISRKIAMKNVEGSWIFR